MEITNTEYINNIRKIEASLANNPGLYPDKGELAEKHPNALTAIIKSREAYANCPDPFLNAKI